MRGPIDVRVSAFEVSSDEADLVGLRALLALRDLELDPLVLLQAAVAAGLDRGEVHEHVGATPILADETVALVGVEPLHGSLCHCCSPLSGEGLLVQARSRLGLAAPLALAAAGRTPGRRSGIRRTTYPKTSVTLAK